MTETLVRPSPNEQIVTVLDSVIRVLGQRHHRETIASRLFPEANAAYRQEWIDRDAMAFWCHLDNANRQRTVELARSIYGG